MSDEFDYIIPFDEPPKPELGQGAPRWAAVLNDSIYDIRLTQSRDRHTAARAHSLLQAELHTLKERIGDEPNSEGINATGLVGKFTALEKRLKPFEKMRERAAGAISILIIISGVIGWRHWDKVGQLFR